jgi:flagellin-like protein
MAYTRKNDEAVSPVIGVILMVAITVILAAVIAAFVFGMSGNISKTKTVAWTVQKLDSGTITLVNNGGQDAQNLVKVTTTTDLPGAANDCITSNAQTIPAHTVAGTCVVTLSAAAPVPLFIPVGTVIKLTDTGAPWTGKTKVTLVGTFSDGSDYVLLDTTV